MYDYMMCTLVPIAQVMSANIVKILSSLIFTSYYIFHWFMSLHVMNSHLTSGF